MLVVVKRGIGYGGCNGGGDGTCGFGGGCGGDLILSIGYCDLVNGCCY